MTITYALKSLPVIESAAPNKIHTVQRIRPGAYHDNLSQNGNLKSRPPEQSSSRPIWSRLPHRIDATILGHKRTKRMQQLGHILTTVRRALASNDLPKAERSFRRHRDSKATTPESLEALSWLARGALAAHRFAKAAGYARSVHRLAVRRLQNIELESDPCLSAALGASIEVLAQSKARRGHRSEAIRFLKKELDEYGSSSIGTRIRKNLNLLTMEGHAAPELEIRDWLGLKPPALSELLGQPVLVFFWAHHCDDSRVQGRVLARIREEFESRGLVLIGPTRCYGSLDERGHKPILRRREMQHIQQVLRLRYSSLSGMPVSISTRNFEVYGVSTTPTLVLIDHKGLVSYYHPGKLPYRELASRVRKLLQT